MKLYHTTSLFVASKVFEALEFRPKDRESFVSFAGDKPYFGDISSNQVVIELAGSRDLKAQLERVEYTEDWFHEHADQASYIAGEGWREQFVYEPPEDGDDDDFDEFEDEEDQYHEAEIDAFLAKDAEREWISREAGQPVKIAREEILRILVVAEEQIDADVVNEVFPGAAIETVSRW